MNNQTKKLLEEVEEQLDITNGNYGSEKEFCIFCKSKTYNGNEGIIHRFDCILNMVRKELRKQDSYKVKSGLNKLKKYRP